MRSINTNWLIVIAGLAFVVGLLAWLFGEGVVDRFQRPDVVALRTVTEIPWPETVRELAEQLLPASGISKGMMNAAEQQLRVTPATPAAADAPTLDEIYSGIRLRYPDMTEKDAERVFLTAVLLHHYGLMRTAMIGALEDKALLFPSVLLVIRIVNSGGRVARNVELLLEGDFQLVEQSVQGPARPIGPREEGLGRNGSKRTTLTYEFDRLPAGDEYGSVISLWVSVPAGTELAPPTWLDVKVMHDDGKGIGRVVGGVSHPRQTSLVERALLSVLAVLLAMAATVMIRLAARAIMAHLNVPPPPRSSPDQDA